MSVSLKTKKIDVKVSSDNNKSEMRKAFKNSGRCSYARQRKPGNMFFILFIFTFFNWSWAKGFLFMVKFCCLSFRYYVLIYIIVSFILKKDKIEIF